MKRLFAFFVALTMSSCATVGLTADTTGMTPVERVITKLSSAALPDLQAAAADAQAHNDVVAAQCWNGLIPVVKNIQNLLAPVPAPSVPPAPSCGSACLFSTIQHVRDTKAEINSLTLLRNSGKLQAIRQTINLACGALWVDMNASIVDPLGLNSGPVAP